MTTIGTAKRVAGLIIVLFFCALWSTKVCAQDRALFDDYKMPEPYNTGWAFYIDNDYLALINRDQQYTGGFALTLSGRRAVEYPISLDPVVKSIDRATGLSTLYERSWRMQLHSLQIGLTAFTPENVDTAQAIFDDHPYASLVFIGNTQQTVHLERGVSYASNFTLGVLGTRIPATVQGIVHDVMGEDSPQGWRNQISDGGELTFLYGAGRQQILFLDKDANDTSHEIKVGFAGSVGYVTQLGAGINWRSGVIKTPWWSFTPGFGEYVSLGHVVSATETVSRRSEFYVWGDLNWRYRIYNAFLEGQFRESAVTFDRSQLESVQTEGAIGVTREFGAGFRASFIIRARTPEFKDANPPIWGGLILSRSY